MENQRLFLFVALSLVILLLYSSWQEQYGPKPPATTPASSAAPGQVTPALPSTETASVPSEDIPDAKPGAMISGDAAAVSRPADSTTIRKSQRIRIRTDLLDVEIDTTGGDIRKASLLAFPQELDVPDKPVVLFNDELPRLLIAQSGLVASKGLSADHHVIFKSDQTEYKLDSGNDKIQVNLSWHGENGLGINKIYTFHRNSYVIDMDVEINNGTSEEWTGRFYRQLQRSEVTSEEQSRFIYTFTGGVVSNELNKYEKVDLDEMATWKAEQSYIRGGWVAMIQHYFLGAWIPVQDQYN